MADTTKLTALLNKMPELDRGRVHGPKRSDAEPVYDEILAGGADNIAALVGMLKEVDNGEDWRVRYVLHCIMTYIGAKETPKRSMVADALASQLAADLPKPVKVFVLQQLQLIGTKQHVSAIGKLLTDEVTSAPAAAALTAIRDGASAELKRALPNANGRPKQDIQQAIKVIG